MISPSPPPTSRLPAHWRAIGALGLAVPMLLGLALAAHDLSDLDIWLHDRVGGDLLRGAWPRTNSYSFTAPDHPWVNHEWLFQVLVATAGTGRTGESRAVPWNVLRVALSAGLLLLLLRGDRQPPAQRRDAAARRAAALALPAVAALALLWPRLVLRPELLSLLAFVLALRWIESACRPTGPFAVAAASRPAGAGSGVRRWAPLFSPRQPAGRMFWLTVVWAQCHGFFALAPLLWLFALLLRPAESALSPPGGKPAALATPAGVAGPLIAALLAGLLTPTGLAGLVYPLRALGQLGGDSVDLRVAIAEMAPLLANESRLGLTVAVFKLSLVWSVLWAAGTLGRVGLLRLAVLVFAAAAAIHSQRNLGFYALAFMLVHTGYAADRRWLWLPLWRRLAERGPARRVRALTPAILALMAAAVAAAWLPAILDNRFYLAEGVATRTGWSVTPAHYPFLAARTAAAQGAGRWRLANNIDAASTLVQARAGPVFIDGRTEAYPPAVWRDYQALGQGGASALSVLDRRRADAVVLAHRSLAAQRLLASLLETPGWRLLEADEAGVAFARTENRDDDRSAANAAVLGAAARRLLAATPAQGGARTADRFVALGALLRLAGDPHTADELYRRGLAYCPGHPVLEHNRGNLLLARGDASGALAHFRRALRGNPRLVEARINEGVSLLQLGDAAGAARAFAAALRAAPRRAGVWANLGEARLRMGDRTGALAAYDRALALQPGDAQLRQRAAALRRGG